MSDSPLVGARKFEAYVRWSTYSAVTFPVTTLLGAALMAGRSTGAHAAAPAAALGLVLALGLTAGNIVVVNWSIDTIVGRARRFPVGAVAVWALTLAAFVVVAPRIPLPAMGLAVAAAIASAAASFVPALDARRALLLNAAILVTVALFTGLGGSDAGDRRDRDQRRPVGVLVERVDAKGATRTAGGARDACRARARERTPAHLTRPPRRVRPDPGDDRGQELIGVGTRPPPPR